MVAFLEWLKANKHPVYRLDPLDEVGEVRGSGSRFLIRQTLQIIFLFCLPLFIWTSVATIKDVAHVTGQVMPSGAMQAVQHMEGGIVAEVLVHESQLVDKGQVLLRLDSRQAMPEREQAEVRLAGLQARSARLQAIVDDTEPDYQRISQCFKELVEIQKRIYTDQMATFQSNRAMVEAQIAQRNSELQQTIGDLANAKKQVAVTADMVKIRKELLENKAISKVIYLETLRAHITAQGEVERLEKQVNNIRQAMAETESRLDKLVVDMRQEAKDEQSAVIAEMRQVKEILSRIEDRVERLDIRAEVRGMVQDLKVRTPGTVVQAGKVLLHIVPMDEFLKVEAQIAPEDVGRIAVGQPVVVKLTSYDYATFGAIPGSLLSISPSTLSDQSSKPYYQGIVSLAKNYLGNRPGEHPILPGMLAQVDLALGERTVLNALWQPMNRTFHDAFKER